MKQDRLETKLIEKLTAAFKRSPDQLNGLNQSDAEIIRLPFADAHLVLTTDSINEEIERGLYRDPHMIGWMVVVAALSDIAATGADPVGLLLNETFSYDTSDKKTKDLQKGITDACCAHGTYILGGDTNRGPVMQMAASAVGILGPGRMITRIGFKENHIVYTSGSLGIGNAFAMQQLAGLDKTLSFKPYARLREGKVIRQYGGGCMDTSDGLISTLDELSRLNDVGFVLDADIYNYLAATAKEFCDRHQLPYWYMTAGPHGEFELIFSISEIDAEAFLADAKSIGWEPLRLGKVVKEPGVSLTINKKMQTPDTVRIRNMFYDTTKNIHYYLSELKNIEAAWELL